MIDISKLKELVALMAEHDLAEIEVKNGDEAITIRRGMGAAAPVVQYAAPAAATPLAPQAAAAPAPAAMIEAGPTIDSPMVGTCFLAANPDSPPFIKVGQQVTPDTTVCLIEAMKVFNEIKAEKAGIVDRVLTKNGQAVEFGQKLFVLRSA